ncbi:MAG: SMC-Scp complex subunit ScpB [Pseudomonadota bacterium]
MNEPAEDMGVDAAGPSLFDAPPLAEQERMVEALLFAAAEPMTILQIKSRLPQGCDVSAALELLGRRYAHSGVTLARVGLAWAFRTAPDLGFLMRKERVEERKLSRAAIETLAIIAYHQPATRAEIEEIRGVSVSKGTLDLLLELDWIRLGKRRDTPGRPVTFVTTELFLDQFNLSSAKDLPGLKELRAAGLVDGPERRERLPLPPLIGAEIGDMFEVEELGAAEAEQPGH